MPPVSAQDRFQQGLDAYLNGSYSQALELWRAAAEGGDEVAMFNIGVLYAHGLGIEADRAEALRWYRRSAEAGYANAQFNLGWVYYNGTGTRRDVGQAVAWWKKAARQNHPDAMYNLASLYRDGEVVEQDLDLARRFFQEGAALGDARAGSALAQLKERMAAEDEASGTARRPTTEGPASAGWPAGESPENWAVQVFAVAEKSAAQRFVAEHELADTVRIYEAEVDGKTWFKGVSGSYADTGEARAAQDELAGRLPGSSPWLRRYRSIQTEAVAAIPLAVDTAGHATRVNSAKGLVSDAQQAGTADSAAGASEEAAGGPTQASPTAEDENGSDDNESRESRLAQTPQAADKAVDSGLEPPGDDGSRLFRGQQAFNARNYDKALEIWRPLAEKGMADAQYGIGFMYESGWGVERDYQQAFHWYQLAAQQNHAKSQFNLGLLYQNGRGVARNEQLGLYWIQSAADRGDQRAVTYLENLNE